MSRFADTAPVDLRRFTPVTFELRRRLVLLYAVLAGAFSLALLEQAQRRGPAELSAWAVLWLLAAFCAWRWPAWGPLAAGWAALVLGFVRTYRHGTNLDLGLSLVLVAVAVHLLRSRDSNGPLRLEWAGLALLVVAVFALVSMGFALARIHGFAPAPGFGYHVYRLNPRGVSSEEALVRIVQNAAAVFAWFGCYLYARQTPVARRALALAAVSALAVNSAVLLVQTRVSPGFLHPAGWPFFDRWNGVTSFCYALGDVALALFLALPLWGSWRGRDGVVTAAGVLLVLHAVFASGSRTALGAMVVAVLLWAAVRIGRAWAAGRRLPAIGLGTAVVLLAVGLAAAYRLTPADNSTPLGRLKEGVERQGLLGHVIATRLGNYPLTLRVIREYPLTGVGAGLYPLEIEKYRALLLPQAQFLDPFLVGSYAPNQLLNLGAELGTPAALALCLALSFAAVRGLRAWSDPRAGDLGVSAFVLLAALQLGPGLYNSEALFFEWLVVGRALAAAVAAQDPTRRSVGARGTGLVLAAALGLGIVAHVSNLGELAVEQQWQRLRWRMNIGLLPAQAEGRWTAAEATFSVDTDAPAILVRWHAGDRTAAGYRAAVSFYVDGRLVETSPAAAGVLRETRLPLPAVAGWKRVSVRVAPPFVPARELGGSDTRSLGIFVHAVTPLLRPPTPPPGS